MKIWLAQPGFDTGVPRFPDERSKQLHHRAGDLVTQQLISHTVLRIWCDKLVSG